MTSLKENVVLITGAGRGLGAATARVLGEAGATVIAADIDGPAVEALAAEIQEQGGVAEARLVDICDENMAEGVVQGVVEAHGRIDALVNNAGIDVTVSVEELTVAQWDRIVGVNLRAPFVLSRAAFPLMRRAGGGHIVNVCSTASKRSWANASAYNATKWGLLGFSHALHVEGREANIKVTALVVGGMRTPFLLDRFPDIDLNVLQDPHNVAEAVRFVLTQPEGTVIPEMMVLPVREGSWP
ncbi:MAG TPA: SDR family oxidoreductase [Actinomycetota bacterium]|nr:SDR family oxidoreductase [Actinomycetota bacterium]